MGPFDIQRQRKRQQTLDRIARSPDTPDRMRELYQRLADDITFDPEEYERRVCEVYGQLRRAR